MPILGRGRVTISESEGDDAVGDSVASPPTTEIPDAADDAAAPFEESGEHRIDDRGVVSTNRRHATTQLWAAHHVTTQIRASAVNTALDDRPFTPRTSSIIPSTLPLMNAVQRPIVAPRPPRTPNIPDMPEMIIDLPVLALPRVQSRSQPHPEPPAPLSATKQQRKQPVAAAAAGEPRHYATVKMAAVKVPPAAAAAAKDAAPPSSGRMFDENDFLDADTSIPLDLQALPTGHVGFETMAGPQKKPSATQQQAASGGSVVHFSSSRNATTAASSTSTPRRSKGPTSTDEQRRLAIDPSGLAILDPNSGSEPVTLGDEPPPQQRTISKTMAAIATPGSPVKTGVFAFAGFGLPPQDLMGTPTYALRVFSRRRVLRRDLEIARARHTADVELYEAALQTADPEAMRKGIGVLAALIFIAACFFAAILGAIL